jgi:enamine deaminase RidA (YjgF/YER057c/UK114 family)
MERKIINPPQLPAPRGFSHGILVDGGKILFLAGQDASGSDGKTVSPGNLVGQFRQVLKNLKAVLEGAGGSLQDIVKLNLFVLSRDDYVANLKALGEVYRSYFGSHYPVMGLFEVRALFNKEALIEIEGLAVLS